MKGLTIGQVAKRAQVNIETIRYYERKGLISPPPRRESGYRQYPEDTVNRVQFIKQAQDLGFSLKEIVELLSLRVGPGTACGDVKRLAEAKIADIEGRIRTLQRMKEVLTKLTASCSRRGSTGKCPILEALDTKEEKHAEA